MRELWMGPAPASLAAGYDYVVVGGGTAGCVLANRLSADPNVSVLLVDAGGSGGQGRHKAPLNNSMPYLRGQRADYEGWSSALGTGWTWEEMLPLFRELEDHHGGPSEFHGATGEWRVERQRALPGILEAVRLAAIEAGIPPSGDFNTGDNEGCGYLEANQRSGRPVSAAEALLRPVAHRPNLTITTQALVERIGVEDGKAGSVQLRLPGACTSVRVRREVILAAGAIGSPCILQRSGIGPGAHLQAMGIPVVRDLPAGGNLQDHLQMRPVYRLAGAKALHANVRSTREKILSAIGHVLHGSGLAARAPSQLGIFARSSGEHQRANVQFHVQPLPQASTGKELQGLPAIAMSVCNLRPRSRGTVLISGASAADAPAIDPQHLQHGDDRKVAGECLRLARRIMQQPALSAYGPQEEAPQPQFEPGGQLLDAAGTCRMGLGKDAVVTPDFKVVGIAGLRVADASVMPSITSGNTNAPTAALALKAARTILAEAGFKAGAIHPFDLFRTAIPLW